MKIKTFIVEDEPLAVEVLKAYLSNYDDFELSGVYNDGFSGLKAIQNEKPDVIFLDIQMPKLTGLEILELLDYHPFIVFTTAYDQYAVDAFNHDAVDYLLKPFSEERFGKTIDKIRRSKGNISGIHSKNIQHLSVKKNAQIHLINLEDIYFINAEGDYVQINSKEGKFLKQITIKQLEEKLNDHFIKIHRSYIVNKDQIGSIEKMGKEQYIVHLKCGEHLPVSRSNFSNLKNFLNID